MTTKSRGSLIPIVFLALVAALAVAAVFVIGDSTAGASEPEHTTQPSGSFSVTPTHTEAEATHAPEPTDHPEPTHTAHPEPTGTAHEPEPTRTHNPEPTHTAEPEHTDHPEPSHTKEPDHTDRPEPTKRAHPEPSHTEHPEPSHTEQPEQTDHPEPSHTPKATEPEHTDAPEATDAPEPTATQIPIDGDVDCDGQTTGKDAIHLLLHAANADEANAGCTAPGSDTPGSDHRKGDVNCDGNVNLVDLITVLKVQAGLPVSLPEGCAGA
ncbi:MAG: hypothetical protein ABI559_09420 [Chloroflexota bacterium]